MPELYAGGEEAPNLFGLLMTQDLHTLVHPFLTGRKEEVL
jgi:hypothetical protein